MTYFLVDQYQYFVLLMINCFELIPKNQEREIAGLLVALQEFELKSGLIVTLDQEEIVQVEGYKIQVIPVYKWMEVS